MTDIDLLQTSMANMIQKLTDKMEVSDQRAVKFQEELKVSVQSLFHSGSRSPESSYHRAVPGTRGQSDQLRSYPSQPAGNSQGDPRRTRRRRTPRNEDAGV